MAKKLSEILGESYTDTLAPKGKDFVAKHKIDKVTNLEPSTGDDKLFNASNVAVAPHKGKNVDAVTETVEAPVEQIIFEWRDYDSNPYTGDPDREKTYKMRTALDQSSRWGDMSSRSSDMAKQHRRNLDDKNKPTGLRNLHDKAAAIHDDLQKLYGKISKHHENEIADLISADKK